MELKFYNTLTREKEPFVSIEPGKVGLYTCGPTVYDYDHIGHLRSYIFADTLKRTLLASGYKVKHIENLTDVGHLVGDGDEGEDKMEVGARKHGKDIWEIAKYFADIYKGNLTKANVIHPDVWAPATDYIPEQIEFIKTLEQKGFTYKISDGIYFDTSKLSDYGKLAKLDIAGLREGARVEANAEKRNPTDFALWRFHDGKRQMKWESPWGVGIPGWHIECSAISTKYLSERFDIHTGGIDHIPVHHTNEIAQNEARFGHKVVNVWMHNNFILVNGVKMSKSLGNLYTLDDIEKRGFSPLALRYLYLGTHYRQQLNFTWESLEAAQNAYTKLIPELAGLTEGRLPDSSRSLPSVPTSWLNKFENALSDDLNTPQALAVLWEMFKDTSLSPADKLATALEFDKVLGLSFGDRVTKLKTEQTDIPDQVRQLAEEREQARKAGDFTKADRLRKQIDEMGYAVSDSSSGPVLTKKS